MVDVDSTIFFTLDAGCGSWDMSMHSVDLIAKNFFRGGGGVAFLFRFTLSDSSRRISSRASVDPRRRRGGGGAENVEEAAGEERGGGGT